VTEARRKEWALQVVLEHHRDLAVTAVERSGERLLAALESFEREVAEHARREELNRILLLLGA